MFDSLTAYDLTAYLGMTKLHARKLQRSLSSLVGLLGSCDDDSCSKLADLEMKMNNYSIKEEGSGAQSRHQCS
jgi:hypothetical protein